jgi:DNA-binding response OmpR family regulator
MLYRIARRLDNTQLEVASNGRAGRLLALSRSPHLILLDSHLPDCDAHDLMSYFGRAALRATVPLAVVSGEENDRIRFIRGGAVSFLTKPLRIAEVERSIMTLLEVFSDR